jgi:DNA-3-methyladenine glycosylase II
MAKIQLDDKRIIYLSEKDERLKIVIHSIGSIELKEHLDGYKFLVCEIVGQMLSNTVANKMILRLNDLCEEKITSDKISNIPFEQLKSIGISTAKVQYINALTDVVKNEPDFLMKLSNMNDTEVIKTLKTVRGIGDWTAKMYLLFVLQRDDVLPYEDGAFLQSYRWLYETDDVSKASIIEKCKKWIPYSSIAARYMYRLLDKGYTRITYKKFLESIMQ